MKVTVLQIYRNVSDFPFAIVQSFVDGDIFVISLVHDTFIRRHGISVGTKLTLYKKLYIVSIDTVPSTNIEYHVPDDIFTKWFQFKKYFVPKIGLKKSLILFKAGLETVEDVRKNMQCIKTIKGIGKKGFEMIKLSV